MEKSAKKIELAFGSATGHNHCECVEVYPVYESLLRHWDQVCVRFCDLVIST